MYSLFHFELFPLALLNNLSNYTNACHVITMPGTAGIEFSLKLLGANWTLTLSQSRGPPQKLVAKTDCTKKHNTCFLELCPKIAGGMEGIL